MLLIDSDIGCYQLVKCESMKYYRKKPEKRLFFIGYGKYIDYWRLMSLIGCTNMDILEMYWCLVNPCFLRSVLLFQIFPFFIYLKTQVALLMNMATKQRDIAMVLYDQHKRYICILVFFFFFFAYRLTINLN